jgi:signal transduction histidine kinase
VLAVLNRTIEDYQQMVLTREINITVNAAKDLVIKANPILFEILISNLISNALRHAPIKTEVLIKIEKETLTVLNSGPPLKSPGKIFNRFNQESRSSQGSGLGLAILKKICEVENFSIHYYYSNSRHHFQVSFSDNSSESTQN